MTQRTTHTPYTKIPRRIDPNAILKARECLTFCPCPSCCVFDRYGKKIEVKDILWKGGRIFYNGIPLDQLYPAATEKMDINAKCKRK